MTPNESKINLSPLLEICSREIIELNGTVCLFSTALSSQRASFGDDLTGFEAFVNHVHLTDLELDDAALPSISAARQLAVIIVSCWCVSLLPLLKGRAVLFFAAGASVADFTIRFHLDRGHSQAWADLNDPAFLRREGIAVWTLNNSGLKQVLSW